MIMNMRKSAFDDSCASSWVLMMSSTEDKLQGYLYWPCWRHSCPKIAAFAATKRRRACNLESCCWWLLQRNTLYNSWCSITGNLSRGAQGEGFLNPKPSPNHFFLMQVIHTIFCIAWSLSDCVNLDGRLPINTVWMDSPHRVLTATYDDQILCIGYQIQF